MRVTADFPANPAGGKPLDRMSTEIGITCRGSNAKVRELHNHRRGAAMVELAVVLPLLLFMFVLAIDYSRVFYFTQVLSTCARNGAIYASDSTAAAESPYESVEEAAKADAPAFMRDQLTVSEPTFGTATTSVFVEDDDESATTVTYDFVEVTVSYRFQLITNIPWLSSSHNLSRTVRMRIVPAVPD